MKIYMALKMLTKNFLLNLIIIIHLSLTILFGNVVICIHNSNEACLKSTSSFPKTSSYLVMPNVYDADNSSISKHYTKGVIQTLKKYKNSIEIENSYIDWKDKKDGTLFVLFGYGKNTYNCFNVLLSSGKKENKPFSDGAIPCLISSNFDNKRDIKLKLEGINVVLRPTGIINDKARLLDLNVSMNTPDYNFLFSKVNDINSNGDTAIIFNYDLIKGLNHKAQSSTCFVFDKSNNQKSIKNLKNEIKNYGYIYSFKELYKYANKENARDMTGFLPLVICFLCIAIISTICMVLLCNIQFMRNYSILYICGMNKLQNLKIAFWYMMWHFISIAVLIYFLFSLCERFIPNDALLINSNNYIISILFLLFLIGIYLIAPLILIKRFSPIKQLKESW